jgi:hypothetical protein
MATAKHRAIDRIRRSATFARKLEVLGAEMATSAWMPGPEAAFDDTVQDDVLRLVFMACHPVLAPDARVALTLRFVGGLTTAEIARAYLVPEPTMAQRLVRAKKRLARERPPFELPAADARQARMASVLDVIYLVFNEGYAATSGDSLVRRGLCDKRGGWPACSWRWRPARPKPRARGPARPAGLAPRRAGGRGRRAGAAAGAGPQPVGCGAHPRRSREPRHRPPARGSTWRLHAAGGDCRLPRARGHGRRHRLGGDRAPLHGALRSTRPRRGAQRRGGGRHG